MFKKRIRQLSILFNQAAEKGIFLIVAALVGAILANSDQFSDLYDNLLTTYVSIGFGYEKFSFSFLHFINDFLMAIFFLLIGMEIKKEVVDGHLATWRQRSLPLIAATGGMVVPILIYAIFNYNSSAAMKGWAIPGATDIAFALGMLALFGKGLPVSLRVFLTALAIIDDLFAVVIIALFYSNDISNYYLGLAFILIGLLFLFNRMEVFSLLIYMTAGIFLWYFFYKSGVHATVGGVILGFLIPIGDGVVSPLKHLEHCLEKFVAFIILPLFAFANCGIELNGGIALDNRIVLGVALGLLFGKQIGVMLSSYFSVRFGFAYLPKNASWMQFYGVSILCGIGFTMSLFIGLLAFEQNPSELNYAKLGIVIGSLFSAIIAAFILHFSRRRRGLILRN